MEYLNATCLHSVMIVLLMLALNSHHQAQSLSEEARLLSDLFSNYSVESRPVLNSTTTMTLNVTFTITQILNLDEKQEMLTWVVYVRQTWRDEYLQWEPSKYGGLQSVFTHADKLWTPDLYFYNLVGDFDNMASESQGRPLLVLYSNGTILYFLPVRIQTSCSLELKRFPFDSQNCSLVIGSWVYADRFLDLQIGSKTVWMPKEGAWKIANVYEGDEEYSTILHDLTYTNLEMVVTLKRNPLFYILNLIIPCYLLSGITLMSLFLPAECGERMSVGLTVFMTYSVFTLIVSNIVPDSAISPPIICIILIVNMILSLTINGWTVIIIRIQTYASRWGRPPSWTSKLTTLLVRDYRKIKKVPEPTQELQIIEGSPRFVRVGDEYRNGDENEKEKKERDGDLKKENVEKECYQEEWRLLVLAGDRFLGLVYLLVTLIGLIALLYIAID